MTAPTWPDRLHAADSAHLAVLLETFWAALEELAELLERGEYLLAEECVTRLRRVVVELMLGMNGICWPDGTRNLNRYLGPSQRQALERTLAREGDGREAWVGRAVALIVIYRWYAMQVVERYGLTYPQDAEARAWRLLTERLPEWPLTVSTS